jgi:hypothetical protein
MDDSIQIAWDYLKRAGEIDYSATASPVSGDLHRRFDPAGRAAPAAAVEQSHHRLPKF